MKNKGNKEDPIPTKRYKCNVESPFNIIIEEEPEETTSYAENTNHGESSKNNPLSLYDDSDSSDSSNFGETLKKYLGLTGTSSFIKVVKENT